MRRIGEVAGRVLRPLSAVLDTRLRLDDGVASKDDSASISISAANLVVSTENGRAFTDAERQFLHEVFELVRLAEESDARLRTLEERVTTLERENLDLVIRNRMLSEISARDALTGLYNRTFVMEKIDSEMNRAMRHGTSVSVLMLDIDHFKQVNDSYGHTVGDQVLKSVGQVLRDSCRVYDWPGRYGGEEFCIVLPETRVMNTRQVAERIRSRLEQNAMAVGDRSIIVTASIGVAGMDSAANEEMVSASSLIERADHALYSAKNHGRNRVELWGPETSSPELSH